MPSFFSFVSPKLVSMEDRSHEVLTIAMLFLVLSWVTMGLRVYVRTGMLKSFGMDDWAMLVTLVS